MSAAGDLRLHGVAPDLYLYRGYFSNSVVMRTGGGVVVVDTQVSLHAARRLRQLIAPLSPGPPRLIVNTHYHGDHTGGNAAFPECEIVGTEACRRFVVERDAERFEYADTFGLVYHDVPPATPPTRAFRGHEEITVGGDRLELWEIGRAETPDACVLHWPSRGAVACGDGVATCDYPFLGVPFLDEGLRDDGEWIGFLRRIRQWRPKVLLPGHGPPLVGEAAIAARLDLLSTLMDELIGVSREERARGGSVHEIAARVDARLARYRRRRDLTERTVSQRFAIYRCLNNLDPERAGRGWWHDLRPSVVTRGTPQEGDRLLAGWPAGRASFPQVARRARSLARRRRPDAIALAEAYRRAEPGDARGPGLLSELLLDGARAVRPTVDATEYVAAALRAARQALAMDEGEPMALLTLGCAEVFGGMVLAQPMDGAKRKLHAALASGALPAAQRRKGAFFLGKAHQMEGEDGEADRWFRRALPPWTRPLFPALRTRLRSYP